MRLEASYCRIPMTSQQLEERSQRLEAQAATLEAELTQMKQMLSGFLQKEDPWWLLVALKMTPLLMNWTRMA
jgi:hypothetical protein